MGTKSPCWLPRASYDGAAPGSEAFPARGDCRSTKSSASRRWPREPSPIPGPSLPPPIRYRWPTRSGCYTIDPEVIHVHCLRGVPAEFLFLAKARGTRIVHTTHDLYGICPRGTLVDPRRGTCPGPSGPACQICNQGPGAPLIASLRNHGWFPDRVARALRWLGHGGRSHRASEGYRNLLGFLHAQLACVDHFHFVDPQSERIFGDSFPDIQGTRIPLPLPGAGSDPGPTALDAAHCREVAELYQWPRNPRCLPFERVPAKVHRA